MNLPDWLHCPDCSGRLASAAPARLACTECHRGIPIVDGIADFVGDEAVPASDPHRWGTDPSLGEAAIGDLRGFLTMVHRALKPRGRAWFVVPNRRYRQAVCLAMAEALAQRFARDGAWPEEIHAAVGVLARSRRLLVHQGDADFLAGIE